MTSLCRCGFAGATSDCHVRSKGLRDSGCHLGALPSSLATVGRPARPLSATIGRVAALLAVCVAVLGTGFVVASHYRAERNLSVGRVAMSVEPVGQGALDIFVPQLNSGTRFYGALGLPANVDVTVNTFNQQQVGQLATHPVLNASFRREATDAVSSYVQTALLWSAVAALAGGLIVACLLRFVVGTWVPRLGFMSATAVVTALAATTSVLALLPPQGPLPAPVYYSPGKDLSQGFAQATAVSPQLRRLTVASDLHDNLQAIGPLKQAAQGSAVFFAGDLGQGGTPLEAAVTHQVVDTGHPFVYVAGNHDSDTVDHQLAQNGAIVLTRRGRLLPNRSYGGLIANVDGLRVAGYDDPAQRQSAQRYQQRNTYATPAEQQAFADWLRPLLGQVDVVMVHSPLIANLAINQLKANPPPKPLLLLTGHTHVQNLFTGGNFTEVNGGTVGAGGLEALSGGAEAPTRHQAYGLAVVGYRQDPGFAPVTSDLVTFSPQSGWVQSRRIPLGTPQSQPPS